MRSIVSEFPHRLIAPLNRQCRDGGYSPAAALNRAQSRPLYELRDPDVVAAGADS